MYNFTLNIRGSEVYHFHLHVLSITFSINQREELLYAWWRTLYKTQLFLEEVVMCWIMRDDERRLLLRFSYMITTSQSPSPDGKGVY